MSITTIVAFVLLIVAAVVFFGALFIHRVSIRAIERQLNSAARDRIKKRLQKAKKKYNSIEQTLSRCTDDRKFPETDVKRLLAMTFTGIADTFREENDLQSAINYYDRARLLGAAHSKEVNRFICEFFLNDKKTGPEAVEAYLEYISDQSVNDDFGRCLNELLKNICAVNETMSTAELLPRLMLNQRVLNASKEIIWAQKHLGILLFLSNDCRNALVSFSDYHERNPEDVDIWYWQGLCHVRLYSETGDSGHWHQSEKTLKKYLEMSQLVKGDDGRRAAASFNLARLLYEKYIGAGDINHAAYDNAAILNEIVEKLFFAISICKSDPEYYKLLGNVYGLLGQHQNAAEAFQKVLHLVKQPDEEVEYLLASTWWKLNKSDEAERLLKKIIENNGSRTNARKLLASIYLHERNYSGAEKQLVTVLEHKGDTTDVIPELFMALYLQNKFDDLLHYYTLYEHSLSIGTIDENTGFIIGRTLAKAHRYAQSVQYYRSISPSVKVRYYLGCVYASSGNISDGIHCMNSIIEKNDHDYYVKALAERGKMLLRQQKIEEAEQDLRSVYRIDPNNKNAIVSLGIICFNTGRLEDAATFFNLLNSLAPLNPTSLTGLALLRERENDISGARAMYSLIKSNDKQIEHKANIRIAACYAKEKNWKKAWEFFSRAGFVDENDTDYVVYLVALAAAKCSRYTDAFKYLKILQAKRTDNAEVQDMLFKVCFALGHSYWREGKTDQAIEMLSACLTMSNHRNEVKNILSKINFNAGIRELQNKKDIKKAHSYFSESKKYECLTVKATYFLSLCAMACGRCDDAMLGFASMDSGDPRRQYHMGVLMIRIGERETGLKILRQLEMADAALSTIYTRSAAGIIADECIKAGDYDRAISLLGRLI